MTCAFLLGAGVTSTLIRMSRARRALTDANARDLQAIFARSPDALMRFGSEGRCSVASPSAGRLLGRPPRALVGQPLGATLPDEDRAALEAAAARARQGCDGAEAVFRTATRVGEHVWVEARLTRASDDGSLVAILRDVTTRKSAELALRIANTELNKLAGSDGLTGLANRRRFDQMLDSACRRASRQGTPVSLLLIDLDGLEAFNNRYGHNAGDACLKRVAAAIRGAITARSDLAARFAGEEFAVMLPGRDREAARVVAERVHAAVAALAIPHEASPDGGGIMTASIGYATAEPALGAHGTSGALLIAEADRALFGSKQAGRNRASTTSSPPTALSPPRAEAA